MGGVKTCSTGCSKNNPEYMDNQFGNKRRMKKKQAGKHMNIESNASMSGKQDRDKFN